MFVSYRPSQPPEWQAQVLSFSSLSIHHRNLRICGRPAGSRRRYLKLLLLRILGKEDYFEKIVIGSRQFSNLHLLVNTYAGHQGYPFTFAHTIYLFANIGYIYF
jgi:hypothetical protein